MTCKPLEMLTEVRGIGDSTLDSFREYGYEYLCDLRGISRSEVKDVPGVGAATANSILRLLEREGLRTEDKRTERQERFQELLRELFQFDMADLDFGIYRIMNHKRDEINEFIDEGLLDVIDEELERHGAEEAGRKSEELEDLKSEIREDLGEEAINPSGELKEIYKQTPLGKRYRALKKEIEEEEVSEPVEVQVFNDLINFFKFYYDEGDFVTKRRYSREQKYAVPYNGEEVYLHWANKNQYYVKTGEQFKDYEFRLPGNYHVSFELKNAEDEQNNQKGENKFFLLHRHDPIRYDPDNKTLRVLFEYRPLNDLDMDDYDLNERSQKRTWKKNIRQKVVEKVLEETEGKVGLHNKLTKTDRGEEKTILEKHLNTYTKKYEADYFIHKNLGDFLRRELDFYIKNEIVNLDALGTEDERNVEQYLSRVRVTKKIAHRIIDFLAQIEDFQKKLWEKKKFVVQTDYCITLDKIPEEFYPEILDNNRQIEEWREKYGIKGKIDELYLNDKQSLMVDTGFFADTIKRKMISASEPENLIVKSENFAALELLKTNYSEAVDCIYIDPPYNVEASQVPFKDKYEESSWLTMMEDRIRLAHKLLTDDGIMYVSIDDGEVAVLKQVMDDIFGEDNFLAQLVWDLGTGTSAGHFTRSHEYILAYTKNKDSRENFEYIGDEDIIRERAVKRISDKNPATEITFPPGVPFDGEDKVLTGEIGNSEKIRIKDDEMRFKDGELAEEVTLEAGWAMKDQILSWLGGEETRDTKGQKIKRFVFREDGRLDYEKIRSKVNPKTVIDDVGSTKRGTTELSHKFEEVPSIYPKPTDLLQKLIGWACGGKSNPIIMDFFAGSGTAGESALNLRDQGINLSYVLVEQGEHFYSLLKPRLLKSVYSKEWKDLKPKEVSDRSHSFKYQRLEQYEDTLNNIAFRDEAGQAAMGEFDDYRLKYVLEFETRDSPCRLNVDELSSPFDYELKIREGDETKRKTVDLVETFNYVLGLKVSRIYSEFDGDRKYRVVKGKVDDEKVTVVWRTTDDLESEEEFERDKEFIEEQLLDGDEDTVYANGQCLLEDVRSIERTFKPAFGA